MSIIFQIHARKDRHIRSRSLSFSSPAPPALGDDCSTADEDDMTADSDCDSDCA
jgi:hypothetical protein